MLKGKFGRKDIESPANLASRVYSGFKDISGTPDNLVFAHSGVLQVILVNLGIYDLFVGNCGSLSLVLGSDGVPVRMISYWNHGY